jgi:effector-binding domain-containing protein
MLSSPQIVETAAAPAAIIRLTIARSEMMSAFGPAVGELLNALAAQNVDPIGAVFAHHLTMPPDKFNFELGVRVSAPIEEAGRVRRGELPAARVARTVYTGPYEGLPSAWGEFMTWIKTNGHAPAEDLWEVYTVGPHSNTDPSGWRTELNRPLAG